MRPLRQPCDTGWWWTCITYIVLRWSGGSSKELFLFLMGKILLKSEMRQDVAGRLLGQGWLSGLESSPVGTYVVWFYIVEKGRVFFIIWYCAVKRSEIGYMLFLGMIVWYSWVWWYGIMWAGTSWSGRPSHDPTVITNYWPGPKTNEPSSPS